MQNIRELIEQRDAAETIAKFVGNILAEEVTTKASEGTLDQRQYDQADSQFRRLFDRWQHLARLVRTLQEFEGMSSDGRTKN